MVSQFTYRVRLLASVVNKRTRTLGQKFFSARVVDLWNELDDTVSVDSVTALKRKLGKLGY